MKFLLTKLKACCIFTLALLPYYSAFAKDLPSTVPMNKFWSADYNVSSTALSSDRRTLYLGGSFRYLRSDESGAFVFNSATGAVRLDMPAIQGDVYAAISDGNGGWYIGGNFTMVGETARNGLAHITSGSIVRQAFAPNVSVGTVYALALHGDTLYIGGDFTSVEGEERLRLAAVNTANGALTSWNPAVTAATESPAATIYSMAIDSADGSLYVGGRLTAISGAARRGIARFDLGTGALSSWAPMLGSSVEPGIVYALAFDPTQNAIFAGGYFRSVNGVQTSFHLAGLRVSDGEKLPWSANVVGTVRALALDTQRQRLYFGGSITSVGGQSRNALAAIDSGNGSIAAWNPILSGVTGSVAVRTLQLDTQQNTLYLGGGLSAVNGQTRTRVAAISTETGAPSSWIVPIGLNTTGTQRNVAVLALSPDRGSIFAGGESLILEHRRNRLAAINVETGQVTDWNPDLRGMLVDDPTRPDLARVDKIALHHASGKLYVLATGARYFGGQDLGFRRLSAIDLVSGTPDQWSPDISSPYGVSSYIGALLVDQQNNLLYVGGTFASASGQARRNLVRYRLSDGALDNWDPQVGRVPTTGSSDSVAVLDLDSETNTLYVGGNFGSVGSTLRKRLAAISTVTAQPLAWRPDISHPSDSPSGGLYGVSVVSLLLDRERQSIFVGFSGLYGWIYVANQLKYGMAEISTVNDELVSPGNPFSAFSTQTVYSMVRDEESNLLYIGGRFNGASGDIADRRSLLAMDLSTRLFTAWQPIGTGDSVGTYGNLYVSTLQLDSDRGVLYTGGTFSSYSGVPKSNFAAFQLRESPPSCPADFDGDGQFGTADLFAFLAAWFAQSMTADFDNSGSIAVPDIFAFLTVWFEGC